MTRFIDITEVYETRVYDMAYYARTQNNRLIY